MRFSSGHAFRAQTHHAVTIFGMSGVGKTTVSGLLQQHDWFQYSVDYRIGTRYMGEHIVDNFKREAMKVPFLRQLLRSDSIYIRSNISFENLSPLSTYLGKPGNPDLGGMPFAEYRRTMVLLGGPRSVRCSTCPSSSSAPMISTTTRMSSAIQVAAYARSSMSMTRRTRC